MKSLIILFTIIDVVKRFRKGNSVLTENKKKMTLTVNNINNITPKYVVNNKKKKTNITSAEKTASLVGSTAGMVIAMSAITKKNPLKLVKTIENPKQVINSIKKIELNGKDVIEIATSSIAGGFLAGTSVDSKNTRAKAKEGLTQLIGNYVIPSLFVSGGIKLNKMLNKKFNYPPKIGLVKFAFGMVSLIAGVFAGNYVSKKVNSKVFKEDTNRPLKSSDWGMQLDNVCLVTSMANNGTVLAQSASKIIPIAHIFPGYLTGIKK